MKKLIILLLIIIIIIVAIVADLVKIEKKVESIVAETESKSAPKLELEAKSAKILEEIDEFIKKLPRGWNAGEVVELLEKKFGKNIKIRIVEKNKINFVIISIPGETQQYWVTFQGIKPWGDK